MEKQKTALRELIYNISNLPIKANATSLILELAIDALKKEKGQIEAAYNAGSSDGFNMRVQDYYGDVYGELNQ